MRAGREEKQMRDVKERIRVNEIRDAKSLKSRYKELDEGNGIRDAKRLKSRYEMRVNEYRRAKSGEKKSSLLLLNP